MDTRVPYHNYIVVTPNGDVLGFGEEDDARKYVAGYYVDSFIENIQSSGIFEDEKEELILKLMQEKINLNINDYQVDDLLYDTKVVPNRD